VPVRIVVSDDVDDSGPATSEGEKGPRRSSALRRPDRTLIIPAPARRPFLSHGSINLRSAPIGPFASHNSVFPFALRLRVVSSSLLLTFPLRSLGSGTPLSISRAWPSCPHLPHMHQGTTSIQLFPQSVEQNCDLLVASDADTVIILDHGTFFWATLFLC
jgi:hypothetical protein